MKKILLGLVFILMSTLGMAEKFEKPVLLTSVGQSADVQMVKVLLKKAGVDANFDKNITADKLGAEKTIILAIGGSSKGLGAAGIKVEDEIARTEELISAAKSKGMKVVGMHVGGSARRGDLSDKFVNAASPECDYLIVVEDGNKDGLFTNLSKEKGMELVLIPKISAAVEPLKNIF